MSEAVLDALVKLFALIGDIHDETVVSSREKDIVRAFLSRQLNHELTVRYMKSFEEYLSIYNSESIKRGSVEDRKRISLNAMRILGICEKINEELEQKQKVYIIVQVTEYISLGEEISETELEFLQTVADSFRIDDNEFVSIRDFIMQKPFPGNVNNKVVVAGSSDAQAQQGIRCLKRENLTGDINFLYVSSTDSYIFICRGDDNLLLNGQAINQGQAYFFDHGSVIRGPGIKSIYFTEISRQRGADEPGTGVFIDAYDVSFRFSKSENGIHNLNFHEDAGKLVGILGGSGVGKSTSLSILNGTLKPQKGRVMINGFDLYSLADRARLKGVIGYVPQDDLLIEELTVFENLWFNARMCLSNLSSSDIIKATEKTLYDFDLWEIKDLKVGNPLKKVISGGQRKRLNIALEVIRQPSVLYVDEPTSGLSSTDSETVMNLLKEQTYSGTIVIVNIHQPASDIFKMFDRIMIIDRGGYQVYYGNPNEAVVYFRTMTNHANPEEDQCPRCGNIDTEQVLQIIEARIIDENGKPTRIRKVAPEEWAQKFRNYDLSTFGVPPREKTVLPSTRFSIPGLMKQASVFFSRDFRSKLADRQYIIISLLGPPVLAALLAWFTKTPEGQSYSFSANENIPAFMFMAVITSLFFGLMVSSQEIVRDRKILKRESFLDLSWFSYLSSKVMLLFLISAIQTFTFTLIGNEILEIRGMTAAYWLVLFTTSCLANILGLVISSAFSSVITIYILIPFIIIPQLLFSGVLVKFEKLHLSHYSGREFVPLIGDAMTARWAFEALAVKQFSDNDYERHFFGFNMDESDYSYYASFLIPKLEKDLARCLRNHDSTSGTASTRTVLARTGHYADHLFNLAGKPVPTMIARLDKEQYTKEMHKEATAYLDTLRGIFTGMAKQLRGKKDSVFRVLEARYGRDGLVDLREKHENRKLILTVLNMEPGEQVAEYGDRLVRKYYPAYMRPGSRSGRSHYYAPVKYLGPFAIGTYGFNLTFIWFSSLILFVLLWMNLPRRIVDYFSGISISKSEL